MPSEQKKPKEFLVKVDKNTELKVTVEVSGEAEVKAVAVKKDSRWARLAAWLKGVTEKWPYSLEETLFYGALLVYALTRFIGLSHYPIFFFTDEAIQTNLAADFMRDNFTNGDGEFFPTYFKNVDKFNLGLSVYLQVIPYILFGKSVFVTRAAAVVMTILGAYWLGLIMRHIFKVRYWWASVLVLAISPAWFLHSRTAFETTLMVSLFAGFLYYYFRYRTDDPKKLYWALVLGGLSFYSYSPGRVVIVVTGLFFLFSDLFYHWKQRGVAIRAVGVLVLVALPFYRFNVSHPESQEDHLAQIGSYIVQPIPLQEKLSKYFDGYLYGISPGYWFIHNTTDLERHQMGPNPNLPRWSLVFFALGLGMALANFKTSSYRNVIFAMLAIPSGAALVAVGITRVLAFVIPASILITFGIGAAIKWVADRFKYQPKKETDIALFLVLALFSFNLLNQALTKGLFWSDDYGMGGMQYGGIQLFGALKEYVNEHPGENIIVSPNWANGADIIGRFFFDDPTPFKFGSVVGYAEDPLPELNDTTFVATPDEFEKVNENPKFTNVKVIQTLPYPNGEPGFYFITLDYAANFDEILAQEVEERKVPVEGEVRINGQPVRVDHSPLDMGTIEQLFDGLDSTVTRTLEANPYVLELFWESPRSLSSVSAQVGSVTIHITVELYPPGEDTPLVFEGEYIGSVETPIITLDLGQSYQTDHIKISLQDIHQDEPAHIHLWELWLDP